MFDPDAWEQITAAGIIGGTIGVIITLYRRWKLSEKFLAMKPWKQLVVGFGIFLLLVAVGIFLDS